MPIVYRAQCTACGSSPQARNSIAGFVSTDQKDNQGSILPDGYLALRLDDGKTVCLPHPLETSTLQKQGYSWTRAAREGKLLKVQYKICIGCGTTHEARRITNSSAGCSYGLILSPIVLLLMRFLLHASWPAALLCGYLGLFAIPPIASGYSRLRWHRKNTEFKILSCPSCNGNKFTTVSNAVGKPQMCPHCRTRNMQYTRAGIS